MTTPILLLSLLLSSAAVVGQTTTQTLNPSDNIWSALSSAGYDPDLGKLDTIRCIMLCVDTSGTPRFEYIPDVHQRVILMDLARDGHDYEWKNNLPNWTKRGYEVIKNSGSFQVYSQKSGGDKITSWSHECYLDEKKKPLKCFVWLSKQIQ